MNLAKFNKQLASRRAGYALVVGIVLVGGFFTGLTALRADREKRDDLLIQARLVKQALDVEKIKKLGGISDDLYKSEYRSLKNQVIDFRTANSECRFLYLMGCRVTPGSGEKNGQVFFFLDSEREGSQDYSPPGDIYSDMPVAYRAVFATQTAAVIGPKSDRWGTWVTALVPIVDSATGALIAVMGMDVDARVWRWDVVAKTALPISVILVLLIVLAAGFAAVQRRDDRHSLPRPIQRLLLMPLTVVLLALTVGLGALLVRQERNGLDQMSQKTLQDVTGALASSLEQQSQTLDAWGVVLLGGKDVSAALKDRDRQRLLACCRESFEVLKSKHKIYECAFVDPERVCMLRLQASDRFNDRVNWAALIEAERRKKPASGIELEPAGDIVLMSVFPVYDGGMLIGYLQISESIGEILDALHAKIGIDYAVVVPKSAVVRGDWEKRADGVAKGRWDQFSDYVLSASTRPVFTPQLQYFIEHGAPSCSGAMETVSENRTWRLTGTTLRNVAESEVGKLVVFLDVSGTKASQNRLNAVGLGAGLVLMTGLLGLLYVLLRRTDNSIHAQQEKLQKSEQRLSSTLRSIGEGVITTDAQGHISDLNPVAEKLTGWTQAEAVGRDIGEVFRIVDAETRAPVVNLMERALREGIVVEFANHTVLLARDGTVRQIADSCAPVRQSDGAVVGAVLVFRDVSEDYCRRAALRASEERHRTMFEENPSIQLLIEEQTGSIIDANPAACSFYGYSRERMRQLHISDINTFSSEEHRHIWDTVQNKQNFHFFFQHRLANGQVRDVESYVCSLVIEGRECVYTIVHDITIRKRMEQELRASELRLRTITDSAQDAILMMDADGNISFFNPAAEKLFGYASPEVLGHNLHELLAPPRYHSAYRAAFGEFRKTGQGTALHNIIELQALHKSGAEIAIELSLSAVYLDSHWCATGILRDITDRKRAKEELLETNRRLVETTNRANELAEKAQMATIAKSDFLANMSHEIRTPMNGVIGMTGLLLDTELTEEQRRYAETVCTCAESLLGLINDILDFSKIEAGKMTLEATDFDLQELVEELASTLALRAQDKGLELLYSIASEVPTLLRGDPGRLRQILTNLVGNAIKFTQAGEVAIRIALESEDAVSAVLRLSVRDTGIGIPSDKIGLLFEKFSQADTSTTRKYGGTGLGLAICKQLAELMGGGVSVASEEGRGSEFSATVRVEKQEGGAELKAPSSVDLCGVRVLIVDDNATSREILTTYLTSWGMRPSETADGPAALSALREAVFSGDPFRVAVLDMQMPVMDGEMLGRAIRSDERLNGLQLVLLTSLGMRDNAACFHDIDFAACLTKPTRHHELKRALAYALTFDANRQGPLQTEMRHPQHADLSLPLIVGRARILLVEDNITNQQVALGILKKLGVRADAVANGEEALRALETMPYDLVLMDVQMPVMDGLEAARQIRSESSSVRNHKVPVIAMTARAMRSDQEKCLAAGMDDYVSKPVTPLTLARVLKKWLAREEEGRRADRSESAENGVPSPAPSEAVWNLGELMQRVMDDRGLARTVLREFIQDFPKRMVSLRAHLEDANFKGIELEAHSIKGAAANIGGELLRGKALALEHMAKNGNGSETRRLTTEMALSFDVLKKAIEDQLREWMESR